MLAHHLSGRTPERNMARQHLPKRHPKGVKIRTDVQLRSSELFWTGERGCPCKTSKHRNRRIRRRLGFPLCQSQVDNFRVHGAACLQVHHDIAWLDVPVDKALLVHGRQTRGDLSCNFQRQLRIKPTQAFDEILEGFAFDELHRVEVTLGTSAEMEY